METERETRKVFQGLIKELSDEGYNENPRYEARIYYNKSINAV